LSPEDDVSLAEAVLRKDRKATAKLVELHADAIYAYVASRLIPQIDKVDDLVQEIFLAAWKGLAAYRGDSRLRSWLLGIARHKVEDYYRVKLSSPEELPVEDAGELPAEADLEIEEMLDQAQLREKVHGILESMPQRYALVLLWRYWEERSAREISQQTGRTEKAVERWLARARAEFRERWTHA
jgi:RNA polymerase sigma-70 factor, ECF subfamily